MAQKTGDETHIVQTIELGPECGFECPQGEGVIMVLIEDIDWLTTPFSLTHTRAHMNVNRHACLRLRKEQNVANHRIGPLHHALTMAHTRTYRLERTRLC